jgi:hypothetical protein
MITVMNVEEEFPVVFTVATSQSKNVWQNYCDTIMEDRSVYDETVGYWDRLVQTILMRDYRGIIDYNNGGIRFRTEADLTLFLLRFS